MLIESQEEINDGLRAEIEMLKDQIKELKEQVRELLDFVPRLR